MLIFSTPTRHLIYRDLLMVYIFFSCDPQLTSVDLSLDASVFSPPKPLSLTPNLFPWDSQAFSSFSSLGKLLISFIYMHFMFWNLRFGVFEKFWGFSKLMSYCWNFGMGFAYMILKLHALHHTCIITIFHAFRCVLYMFNWFYAGRIGLGWAHDAISFACHMFMHFPCIRSPLLNILVILNCFGAFLIVSFFPLSILFTLVVSMVPKRKSTPARDPLHSGASSSSDHAPLSLHFRNDDAHKAFTENFSRWGIHSERWVVLGHFADTNLPTVIHSQEWESLCDEPVTCPLVLIQEFYFNMHGINHSVPHFVTRVRGISIPVTP